ncbi:homoserine acetyltransferase [Alsobacter soli]|uniref:Probable acyltransferase n=1 Tax=Alsobacter soli TaxID=2109933 RepID=A0A2T1HUX8_9HYPH|nr:homoserine O-acetyltransferase [Alsobacter soli]PSC05472.1 homoserine acetyltransferase [Alsobacter soli]
MRLGRIARAATLALALVGAGLGGGGAAAEDLIVQKKTFEMPSFTTQGGRTIKNVKIGWESYGALNADRSNAILVTHFFSGTSHAAGKYAPGDKTPGYWDAIIGPGKAIDTNKFFVIASDTLVNLNTGDPKVVTTGPASIDPDTGKPYGLNFPVVSFRDFVEVQKALVESLGISKLHAVAGASMGALQAYEWAADYPDKVGRLMAVIGAADSGAWGIAWLDVWASPIRVDPKWNNGDYYGKEPPTEGLKQALKVVSLHANHWLWAEKTFGRAWAEEGKDPAAAIGNRYKIEQGLEQSATARAAVSDANHFLYLVKANQLFMAAQGERLKAIKAPTLILYSPTDQVFDQSFVKATADIIRSGGAPVETGEIGGNFGHLNGVVAMAPLSDKVRGFMEK